MTFDQSDQELIASVQSKLGKLSDEAIAISNRTAANHILSDRLADLSLEIDRCSFALSDFLEGMNNRREIKE